jgi:hypothetical protein
VADFVARAGNYGGIRFLRVRARAAIFLFSSPINTRAGAHELEFGYSPSRIGESHLRLSPGHI